MSRLEALLRGEFFNWARIIEALLTAMAFLLIAVIASRTLRAAVRRVLERDERGLIDRTAASFLTQLAQTGIYFLALIFYAHMIPELRALGTGLLASVSVVSVVIGFAAQNTLGNLIAGFSLLLYRPFRLGDVVQVTAPTGLETGAVETLTLGYTTLRTADNRRVVVPNSAMATQVTVNLTARDPRVMAVVSVGIAYDADIDKARRVLVQLAQVHPRVEEVVGCPVTRLGDSSVVLALQVWCANAGTAQGVEYDLYEQAKKRFDEEGIEIPFPSTTVVLKRAGGGRDPRGSATISESPH